MAIIPTSWSDLDWSNPNPADVRYYQSLILALHERMWQQPLTPPLESNIYTWYIPQGESQNGCRLSTTEDDYRYGRITIPVWDFGSIPRVGLFANIYSLFNEVAFGVYNYLSEERNKPIYNYIQQPVDNFENVLFNNRPWYKPVTIDYILDRDTCGMLHYPQIGEMIDCDNAVHFLKSMKAAIQKLRYIPAISGNYFIHEGANCEDGTLADAVAYCMENMDTAFGIGNGKTHDPHGVRSLYWASHWQLICGWGYSASVRHSEVRWINTLGFDVDLYAKFFRDVYDVSGVSYPHYFDPFDTDFYNGQVVAYGKKAIGEGIDSIFGAVYPYPKYPNFDPSVSPEYSMSAALIADAGPYFNFNCSD